MPAYHNNPPGKTVMNRAAARHWAECGEQADDTVQVAGPLNGGKLRFYTAPATVNPATPFEDFVFADLSGDSTTALTFAPALNEGTKKVAKKIQLEAVGDAAQVDENIQGAVIVNDAVDDWIAARHFDATVNVSAEGDAVSADMTLSINIDS